MSYYAPIEFAFLDGFRGMPFTMSLRRSVRDERIVDTNPSWRVSTATSKPRLRQNSLICDARRVAPSCVQRSDIACLIRRDSRIIASKNIRAADFFKRPDSNTVPTGLPETPMVS